MSEIWREEIERVAGAYGFETDALESSLLRREEAAESEKTSVADGLSSYFVEFGGLLALAANGSQAARIAVQQSAEDLAAIAALFGAPGLERWARETAGENGPRRFTSNAADLFVALAGAVRDAADVEVLRERDREWAELPTAPAAPAPEPEPVVEPERDLEPEEKAPPEPAAPAPEAAPVSSTYTALVIDAPSIGREFLVRLLIQAELSVETADNGFEAERALARRSYDVVFVDLGPGSALSAGRLADRPDLAERMVFLCEPSRSAAYREFSSLGPVIDKPPSKEEVDGLLNRYFKRIDGRNR
jgi:hypothetical protein